jgi:starch phosphorylase
MSLVEETGEPKIRMAHLAIVGTHSTNGVAEIHSGLLRATTVKDFAEMFPERFNNKTNGVTPRRWLLLANPGLAHVITTAIGNDWIADLNQLKKLKPLADDAGFRHDFAKAKRLAKEEFAPWLKSTSGQIVDPNSIFDCQIKRIHEYKRQLLNALRIVILYNRLRANPNLEVPPRTFIFAGKAAPAYRLAKLIIKFPRSCPITSKRRHSGRRFPAGTAGYVVSMVSVCMFVWTRAILPGVRWLAITSSWSAPTGPGRG